MQPVLSLSHSPSLNLIKTQSISFPRSGHHLVVDCLIKYFNRDKESGKAINKDVFQNIYHANEFNYCEFYKHCKETPCSNSNVNFQKNHDFNLYSNHHQDIFKINQPRLDIDTNQNYIIQFRENPVFSIISEYKRLLKVSAYSKFNNEDSANFFNTFCADYIDYWVSFVNKWVIDSPSNALVFSYESFLEQPQKLFTLVLNSIGVNNPDLDLIEKIVFNSKIEAKSIITSFKYYETHLSQMNDKYLKDLKLQLSNSPKLQKSLFISEKSNVRKMTAEHILLRENEKMKSNYEKAKVYEKAIDSIENSLRSTVNLILIKDDKIEQLQNRVQELNELIKNLQEATLGTENKFQEIKESLQSKLKRITLDKESLISQNTSLNNDLRTSTQSIKNLKASNAALIINKENETEAKLILSNQISTLENFLNQQITENIKREDYLQKKLEENETEAKLRLSNQISTHENFLNQQIYENKKRENYLQEKLEENENIITKLQSTVDKNIKLEDLISNNDKELFYRAQLVQKLNIEIKESIKYNLILKSKVYSLESSLKDVKSSYSWKIGYKITRVVFGLFRWTLFVKNRF